jgi:hypothetical protein
MANWSIKVHSFILVSEEPSVLSQKLAAANVAFGTSNKCKKKKKEKKKKKAVPL